MLRLLPVLVTLLLATVCQARLTPVETARLSQCAKGPARQVLARRGTITTVRTARAVVVLDTRRSAPAPCRRFLRVRGSKAVYTAEPCSEESCPALVVQKGRAVVLPIDCDQGIEVATAPLIVTCRQSAGAGYIERRAMVKRGAPPLVVTTGSVPALSPEEKAEGACEFWAAGWVRARPHVETFEPQGRAEDSTANPAEDIGEGIVTRWELRRGAWTAVRKTRKTYPLCKNRGDP